MGHAELTIQDQASRYLIRLVAVERMDGEHVWAVLDAAFREFGLPNLIRSDNGSPFASTGAGGLSSLSVRLIKAGEHVIVYAARQTDGTLIADRISVGKDGGRPFFVMELVNGVTKVLRHVTIPDAERPGRRPRTIAATSTTSTTWTP